MTGKEQVVEELGDLLLPNVVNKALAANDRAKYFMTLLQSAKEHAEHPDGAFANLREERKACGIQETTFDNVVERSSKQTNGTYCIPDVARVHRALIENVQMMLVPIEMAASLTDGKERGAQYQHRVESLTAEIPSLDDDLISESQIDGITSAQPDAGDSIHLIVMNLHKELNRLQQQIATESIDGARVYGITETDRAWIAAFMRGVNRTRQLKFDHPGLDTTATHAQKALVIQNDIGTTDAHVLVIHVEPPNVTVTYTDVHIQRLDFFQNMLDRFRVQWDDTRSRRSAKLSEESYHLCVGRFTAETESQLAEYLEFLGSRLVFLIDWNRARKRLRRLAPKGVCLDVLQWASENDYGHMAFLNVGGEQMVFDALQFSSRASLQVGGQLSDMIGAEGTTEFLKFTLKTAAEGLLADRSGLLIRDEVRAELRHYLESAHQGFLDLAAQHAAFIVELSSAARDCLLAPDNAADPEYLPRIARRAKQWEHAADELVMKARTAWGDKVETKAMAELLHIADDAADELEEGIFLLTLLQRPSVPSFDLLAGESRKVLEDMAHQLVHNAQEYLKVAESSRCIQRDSPRQDMADFLEAVDRNISLEHETDEAHRRAKASILTFAGDFKQLQLFTAVADAMESASDALMRAALVLRDYILDEVITR